MMIARCLTSRFVLTVVVAWQLVLGVTVTGVVASSTINSLHSRLIQKIIAQHHGGLLTNGTQHVMKKAHRKYNNEEEGQQTAVVSSKEEEERRVLQDSTGVIVETFTCQYSNEGLNYHCGELPETSHCCKGNDCEGYVCNTLLGYCTSKVSADEWKCAIEALYTDAEYMYKCDSYNAGAFEWTTSQQFHYVSTDDTPCTMDKDDLHVEDRFVCAGNNRVGLEFKITPKSPLLALKECSGTASCTSKTYSKETLTCKTVPSMKAKLGSLNPPPPPRYRPMPPIVIPSSARVDLHLMTVAIFAAAMLAF